mmetsp:Transcript_33034/g.51658  ORF Transcript_33034/g.51658 Transcript_33034/m.51658 type:complete len:214 (+) Transcript_33034:956-1597(+)
MFILIRNFFELTQSSNNFFHGAHRIVGVERNLRESWIRDGRFYLEQKILVTLSHLLPCSLRIQCQLFLCHWCVKGAIWLSFKQPITTLSSKISKTFFAREVAWVKRFPSHCPYDSPHHPLSTLFALWSESIYIIFIAVWLFLNLICVDTGIGKMFPTNNTSKVLEAIIIFVVIHIRLVRGDWLGARKTHNITHGSMVHNTQPKCSKTLKCMKG